MLNASNLPFDLTPKSLSDWLALIERLPASRSSTLMLQALKQLKANRGNPAQLLPLLILLTPRTLQLADELNNALNIETKDPEKQNKAAKLCIQLIRQLGLLFCQLAESEKLSGDDLQNAIYYALHVIGHCMRLYAKQYEMASATLWKKSGILYRMALFGDIQNLELANLTAELASLPTIENVVQRNLLFYILSPGQFEKGEIDGIFELAGQQAPRLRIGSPHVFTSICFYWDLSSDVPPAPLKHVKNQFTSDHLAINCRDVGHSLHFGELTLMLSRKTQAKLVLILTCYDQIFSSIVPGLPSRAEIMVGLKSIFFYLQEQSRLSKIMNVSAQISGAPMLKRDLSLVPLEHQRNVFEVSNHSFVQDQPGSGKAIFVLRTPNQNYLVIDGKAYDCTTGDLVLLCKAQHPNTLFVVREQRQHDLSGSTHILLEKLANQCELHHIVQDDDVRPAIISETQGGKPEIYLGSGKHSVGDKMTLENGKTLRLLACLEANEFFVRFQFSFTA